MQGLFFIVLFLSFCLPTNSSFYVNIPGVQLKLCEIGFILLPLLNYLKFKSNGYSVKITKSSLLAMLLIAIVVINEFVVKFLIYNQSPVEAFKSVRIGLALFAGLIIMIHGLQFNVVKTWNVLLAAICLSVIFSIFAIFVNCLSSII